MTMINLRNQDFLWLLRFITTKKWKQAIEITLKKDESKSNNNNASAN